MRLVALADVAPAREREPRVAKAGPRCAIGRARLAPARALGRSAELVRSAFWPVACSVTAMVILEEVVIHLAHYAGWPTGQLGFDVLGKVLRELKPGP